MVRIISIILLSFALMAHSLIPSNYKAYCDKHKLKAKLLQNTHGIPPSITFAQAIIESGAGRSNIAKEAKNHFGIRCGDNWDGETYYSKTGCWRAYDSVGFSFVDHAEFLCEYYPNAVGKNYKYWGGLEGYGGVGYWQKIVKVIERYKLYEYDK